MKPIALGLTIVGSLVLAFVLYQVVWPILLNFDDEMRCQQEVGSTAQLSKSDANQVNILIRMCVAEMQERRAAGLNY